MVAGKVTAAIHKRYFRRAVFSFGVSIEVKQLYIYISIGICVWVPMARCEGIKCIIDSIARNLMCGSVFCRDNEAQFCAIVQIDLSIYPMDNDCDVK